MLIVIDSITALLRPEFEKSENIEKTKTLADIALKLKQIAQREKISILLGLGIFLVKRGAYF